MDSLTDGGQYFSPAAWPVQVSHNSLLPTPLPTVCQTAHEYGRWRYSKIHCRCVEKCCTARGQKCGSFYIGDAGFSITTAITTRLHAIEFKYLLKTIPSIATLFAVFMKCCWTQQLGVPRQKYSDVIICSIFSFLPWLWFQSQWV